MKKALLMAALAAAVVGGALQCATSKVNHTRYYHGHIYTKEGQPIPNLRVHQSITEPVGITDENGWFRVEESRSVSQRLTIEFEGKIIDKIGTLRRRSHGHSYIIFSDGRNDTLFIDIKAVEKAMATKNSGQELTADFQQPPDASLDNIFGDIDMVYVEGGTFTMGCTAEQGEDCRENENPAHNVTVSSFFLGRYEVTQRLWMMVMEYNPSSFKGDSLPVEMVTWNGWNAVQTFIERLNEKTGKKYRLPTEAEWEYAARGGNKSKDYKYSGSNDINDVAWYASDSCKYERGACYGGNSDKKTHPVGTKKANELNIHDMSGNVWEWVSDWYGDYHSSEQSNPTGPSSGSVRVRRGSGWNCSARSCRVAFRLFGNPIGRDDATGFRLAHDAD